MRTSPFVGATRADARVALITCAHLPQLEADDQLLAAALAQRGVRVEPAIWDGDVAWGAFDLAVLRSTWDYAPRRDAFVAWAATVPRLANPAPVVAWNTDKRYLHQLSAAGVPVVPTTWLGPERGPERGPESEPGSEAESSQTSSWRPDSGGEIVIKPVVGAGSVDTGRYDLEDADQRRLAVRHVDRLRRAGRPVMVQPYLSAVDTAGETSLLFFHGVFSHAIRKGAMLTGPDLGDVVLHRPENITARQPRSAEQRVAAAALAALPFSVESLLYARVDLVPGPDGEPIVLEVELTEPSLFLATDGGAADRLADAVIAAARACGPAAGCG